MKRYYKQAILVLGLIVVLVIVNYTDIKPLNIRTGPQEVTAPSHKVSSKIPELSDVLHHIAQKLIKRVTK